MLGELICWFRTTRGFWVSGFEQLVERMLNVWLVTGYGVMTAIEKNQELGFPPWGLQWGDARWMAPGTLLHFRSLVRISDEYAELHHVLNPATKFPGVRTLQSDIYAFGCTALEVRHFPFCFVYCLPNHLHRYGLVLHHLQESQIQASYWKWQRRASIRHVNLCCSLANPARTMFGPSSRPAGTPTPYRGHPSG